MDSRLRGSIAEYSRRTKSYRTYNRRGASRVAFKKTRAASPSETRRYISGSFFAIFMLPRGQQLIVYCYRSEQNSRMPGAEGSPRAPAVLPCVWRGRGSMFPHALSDKSGRQELVAVNQLCPRTKRINICVFRRQTTPGVR